jgi:hypothetical protein
MMTSVTTMNVSKKDTVKQQAYYLFAREVRPSIIDGEMHHGLLNKKIGELWKTTDQQYYIDFVKSKYRESTQNTCHDISEKTLYASRNIFAATSIINIPN